MTADLTSSQLALGDQRSWVLGTVLETQAERRGNQEFLQFRDHRAITFGDFNRQVNRVAHGLTRLGVGKSDAVMVMMPNSAEFVIAWFAIAKLGAVTVPTNTFYKGVSLEGVANNCKARICVTHPQFLEVWANVENTCPSLERLCVVELDSAPANDVSAFRRCTISAFEELYDNPDHNPNIEVLHSDVASILYTSGTTGPSKGVLMPHAQCYLFAQQGLAQMRVTERDVYFTCLPLYHVAASYLALYCMLVAGGKLVLYPTFQAGSWIADIRRSKATITQMVGVMADFVYKQPARPDDSQNELRAASVVPMPEAILDGFRERFGIETILTQYGMTELAMCICMPWGERRRGSCGKADETWFDMRIVDPETDQEVPHGETGELVCRPKAPWIITQGYFGMPEETLRSWRNLWFHTGDVLKRDADGYFYFVDRVKDALRRRGENISSYEVESVILKYPSVAECAVVAAKSSDEGGEDEVKACIVLKPGADLDAADLIAFCDARMPYYTVPRYVTVLDELPKTPTGKFRKALLRQEGLGERTWDRVSAGVRLKEEIERARRREIAKQA